MDILLTDVTVMKNDMFCVAGWEPAEERMVRPLPGGHQWSTALIAHFVIIPGVTVRVWPVGSPTGHYPHLTEDTPVDPGAITVQSRGFAAWTEKGAPATATSISSAFNGNGYSPPRYDILGIPKRQKV